MSRLDTRIRLLCEGCKVSDAVVAMLHQILPVESVDIFCETVRSRYLTKQLDFPLFLRQRGAPASLSEQGRHDGRRVDISGQGFDVLSLSLDTALGLVDVESSKLLAHLESSKNTTRAHAFWARKCVKSTSAFLDGKQ